MPADHVIDLGRVGVLLELGHGFKRLAYVGGTGYPVIRRWWAGTVS